MNQLSDKTLKQVILLLLIALIGITLIWQLKYFTSGVLGAITLYILTRQFFDKLIRKYRWKKWLAAITIIIALLIVCALPIWFVIHLLAPKFNYAFDHSDVIVDQSKHFLEIVKNYAPQVQITSDQVAHAVQKVAGVIPSFLNATLGMFVNFIVALFLLYFMFLGGHQMEREFARFLPMNDKSKNAFWKETRSLVISNAVGIPLIMLYQALVASLGFFLFGVDQPIVWGVITGLASVLPVVGSVIVWLPICILTFFSGGTGMGIGLLVYCAVVVSSMDSIIRFVFVKRIGDVHPLITVFGIIVGLQVFGMMGLIFGPLLIAYFFVLVKIYRHEFS